MKQYRTVFLTAVLIILAATLYGQDFIFFTGSAEMSGLVAVPDQAEYGFSLSNSIRLELQSQSDLRAVFQGTAFYEGGYVDPPGRFETTGLPEAMAPERREDYFEVNQAWVEWQKDIFSTSFGYLPIAWGPSWLINPSDRINKRSLETLMDDSGQGLPAVTVDLSLGWFAGLSGYILYPRSDESLTSPLDRVRPENLPLGVKLSAFPGGWEVAGGFARQDISGEMSNWIIAYVTGDIAGLGLSAEAALRVSDESEWNMADELELSVGLSYFFEPLYLEVLAEYIHLGSGEKDSELYNAWQILGGEDLFMAEDYLFSRLSWSGITDLSLNLSGIVNLNDGSLMVLPEMEWEPFADVLFSAGAWMAIGSDDSEFGGSREIAPGLNWKPWDEVTGYISVKFYY